MLADQLAAAVEGARSFAHLDNLARLTWRGLAEGHLSEPAAEAIGKAVDARRGRLKGFGALSVGKPPLRLLRPVSPDRRKSIERRRRTAACGALPSHLAASFTQGQVAVLSVVAREIRRRGRCEMPIDKIAALAGVCRTLVQDAMREARRLGLIVVTERRRAGQRSGPNLIEVVSPEWRAWLRLGGDRAQKSGHHGNQKLNGLWATATASCCSRSVPDIVRHEPASQRDKHADTDGARQK